MSRVEFRAEQGLNKNKPDEWVPVIAIGFPGKTKTEARFIGDRSFPTLDEAKNCVIGAYMILTGKQNNITNSDDGDA